jgi:CRISPR-associated endonuclease/helicase Cas3
LLVYAHSRNGRPSSEWHQLDDHLASVGQRAGGFASKFGSGDWGYLAGLWHDVGKFDPRFQSKLRGETVALDHSVVGAALAVMRSSQLGWNLAFPIAGHHCGLADLRGEEPPSQLANRVGGYRMLAELLRLIPASIANHGLPELPARLRPNGSDRREHMVVARRTEFWIRFIFSALVDADWMDTEHFFKATRTVERQGFSSIPILSDRLAGFLAEKQAALSASQRAHRVNRARAGVLAACRSAAHLPPGFFSLTAPTGSGKTLSGLSFALTHAEIHQLDRIIVALPYTSIIEQNAAVYRQALGDGEVVEHHSNLDSDRQRAQLSDEVTERQLLASENWDAPLIVTTTVQLFESLFANRPSRCRKLHNVARSVIILDEVQALPNGFLLPILDSLKELVSNYGCTVLLSTATPPAFERRVGFELGLDEVRHIIPDPAALAQELSRVIYTWPEANELPKQWRGLAEKMAGSPRFMAIVHRRSDARDLALQIQARTPEAAVFHLSALMCAAHRTRTLAEIRRALDGDGPCRLVATQLVEAGVDIDFPVVWRALGALDSIVQAGGRCNREGTQEFGRLHIYRAPTPPPPGTPRKALDVTDAMLQEHGGALDLLAPAIFDDYFRRLYMLEDQDKHHIQTSRQAFRYATVARDFQMIEDGFSEPVVVPYGDAAVRLDRIRRDGPSRGALRRLQRYVVNTRTSDVARLQAQQALEEVLPGLLALRPTHYDLYHERFGLVVDQAGQSEST